MISSSWDRQQEIRDTRHLAAIRALEWLTDQLRHRGAGTAPDAEKADKLDEAATALADALRKPETCPQCHQEIKQ